MQAQFVTVPILDARLQDLKAQTRIALIELEGKIGVKLEQTKAELVRWVFLAMLGNIAVAAVATALLNAFKNL